METHRRRFLAAAAVATAGLAGCSSGSERGGATTDETTSAADSTTEEETTDGGTTTVRPGEFVLLDASVESTRVAAGGNLTVQTRVANAGGEPVDGEVRVRVGEQTETSRVELAGEAERTHDVSVPVTQPGRLEVEVNGEYVEDVRVGRQGYRMHKYDARNTGRGFGAVADDPGETRTLVETAESPNRAIAADAETVYAYRPEAETLVAADIESGQQQWARDVSRVESTVPFVQDEGRLFVCRYATAGADWQLEARSTDDGSVEWTAPARRSLEGMTYANGTLYVTSNGFEPTVTAFDPADGSAVWSTGLDTPQQGTTVHHLTTPAVFEGGLYVSGVTGGTGVVFGVDVESREQRWSTDVGGAGVSPVVFGDKVYVRSNSGIHHLTTRDGLLGHASGLHPGTTYSNIPNPAPAVVDDVLYGCSSRGEVQAAGLGSAESWSADVGERCGVASPVVVDGTVVFQSANGIVFGYDAEEGTETFSVTLEGDRMGGPAFVVDGRVVASTTTGVHAVDVQAD